MGDALRDKLRSEVLKASWDDLAPHFARGAMLLVAAELDLLDVGTAFARDDTEAVQAWLAAGQLRRPGDDEARGWVDDAPAFQAVILQPWVLVQPLS